MAAGKKCDFKRYSRLTFHYDRVMNFTSPVDRYKYIIFITANKYIYNTNKKFKNRTFEKIL